MEGVKYIIKRMNKIIKKICLRLLVCAIVLIAYISIDIYTYGNVNELVKADAAIVLGAAAWDEEPSPVFEERIKHGIWLYKNGFADKLIFTGGTGKNANYSESSIAREYALENFIPSKDILIEERSTITQENLLYASEIVRENNFSKVIIVSDPLHMKRAMLLAKDCGLEAYSSPTPTTLYKTVRSKSSFLAREVFFYMDMGFIEL